MGQAFLSQLGDRCAAPQRYWLANVDHRSRVPFHLKIRLKSLSSPTFLPWAPLGRVIMLIGGPQLKEAF